MVFYLKRDLLVNILERIPELACCQCKGELEIGDKLECPNCGISYEIHDGIGFLISEETLKLARDIEVQDRVAIEYENKRYQGQYSRRYHDWWTGRMLSRVNTDGRILDNGCGIGLLFERLDPCRVVGLDLSIEMLRRASKYSDQLVLGSSEQLPFKDDSFDMVFCRSLIHHLPNPCEAVREMHRVLKPGGEVVLVETNSSLISTIPRIIANRGEHFSEEHKNLSKKLLFELFGPYFKVDEVSYFGYIAYPLIGFPDIINAFRFFPFKSVSYSLLMGIDTVLSHIPLIRTQSWAILMKATVSGK
ncbi:MAG: methyltransferase domain-containing protein [Sedimentisphaerales bacterium]|nr:methyltransferase domain-containing protein [Sedimentisphaerales bacterium]